MSALLTSATSKSSPAAFKPRWLRAGLIFKLIFGGLDSHSYVGYAVNRFFATPVGRLIFVLWSVPTLRWLGWGRWLPIPFQRRTFSTSR
jgi:hypothetical protein